MKVGVVCDPFAALGFRLAGLAPTVAPGAEAARALLEEMVQEPGWGVILFQEDLIPDLSAVAGPAVQDGVPLLIPFPGPELEREAGEAERYVADLLRRAIGYRVRLR